MFAVNLRDLMTFLEEFSTSFAFTANHRLKEYLNLLKSFVTYFFCRSKNLKPYKVCDKPYVTTAISHNGLDGFYGHPAVHEHIIVVRPNKKICVVQITIPTFIFYPYPKLFFLHFCQTVHLKKNMEGKTRTSKDFF